MSCVYLPNWTKAPTFQEVSKNKDILYVRSDENGLYDDQIANQSMKYKSSLLPDDQISSQSIKYKSNPTPSSTNEVFFHTTYHISLFYLFFYAVFIVKILSLSPVVGGHYLGFYLSLFSPNCNSTEFQINAYCLSFWLIFRLTKLK